MNRQIENIIKNETNNNDNDFESSYSESSGVLRNKDIPLLLLNKILNPHEFIFSKVPNTKLSVSKLKPFSNTFYIFMEIINMFNLLDFFEEKNIKTIHYGPNSTAIIECLDMLREDSNDINFNCHSVDKCITMPDHISSIELLSFELMHSDYNNINNYIFGFINILCNIIQYQSANGIAIIKVQNIFYKPIIDILYTLSSMYEKVYIIKPNNSCIYYNDRYIVCKNFILNMNKQNLYNEYLTNLNKILIEKREKSFVVCSLLKNEIPYYFLNKIEESNIIIGHQQLEYMDQLLSLYKNKNNEYKIELIKKNNIQKCIQWCEKFKIPYNKFTDKVNIFLPLIKISSNDFYMEEAVDELRDEIVESNMSDCDIITVSI